MSPVFFAWTAIAIYVLLTIILAVRGAMRTSSLASFAVGNRDIPAAFVGLSLAAQLTSVATFVVNPGLIYAYGLAGLLGLGGAAAIGIILGLVFFSRRFRAMGETVQALTIPQWIGARYQTKGLRIFFGLISLALISFAVLIVVAISLVLGKLLMLNPNWIVIGIVVFVFSYVMLGGVNTHAYTNSVQAMIMLIVAIILIASQLPMFWQGDGIFASLRSVDVNLVAATNPASLYFRNIFEVFVCNFIVGLAIVCQPHILSKALYLKEDRQVKQYLSVAILTGVIFVGVMVVGLYARVLFMPLNTVDAAYSFITGSSIIPMDHVVPTFIAFNFSPFVSVIIGIGVLCAGLSTLEGILLALSAIISNDLYLPIKGSISAKKDAQTDGGRDQSVLALRFARLVMIGVAIVTILISFRQLAAPTGGSVAIFAQYGVYLLFTVSFLPLACGMFFPSVPRSVVSTSVFTALTVYLLVANLGITHMHNNPAFLATVSIIAGWLVIAFGSKLSKR